MNKDKLSVAAGFMPALALGILLGFQYAAKHGYIQVDLTLYGLTAAAAFFFPFILLLVLGRGSAAMPRRFGGVRPRWFPFILTMSAALSLLSFLINWFAARLFSVEYTVQSTLPMGEYPLWQLLLVSVVLPAVFEELFFRGALLPALEGGSFYSALIVSAFAFALVHGDLMNMGGPFAAGLVYGYMTYITGSVWAAVAAHCINNGMTFLIAGLLEKYAAVGLWEYFLIVVLLLFFLLLYFAMGSLERLVEKGRVPRIRHVGLAKGMAATFFSPGIWVLVCLYLFKALYL